MHLYNFEIFITTALGLAMAYPQGILIWIIGYSMGILSNKLIKKYQGGRRQETSIKDD